MTQSISTFLQKVLYCFNFSTERVTILSNPKWTHLDFSASAVNSLELGEKSPREQQTPLCKRMYPLLGNKDFIHGTIFHSAFHSFKYVFSDMFFFCFRIFFLSVKRAVSLCLRYQFHCTSALTLTLPLVNPASPCFPSIALFLTLLQPSFTHLTNIFKQAPWNTHHFVLLS